MYKLLTLKKKLRDLQKPSLFILMMLCLLVLKANAFQDDNMTVAGTIKNETGETMPGVNIVVKGTTRGTTTDADGKYKISVPEGAILVFSSIGYSTEEIAVANRSSINLAMIPDIKSLGEVVVVGYGTQKKTSLTTAVATVDAKIMENRGIVSNPLSTLQGQVPGVIVTRGSAAPGQEDWQLQIRGAASINGTEPLVIVDDVPIPNNSALNSINPADIDNISFLKDAAAAIYGARAAGGVVMITTKKAKSGKPRIEYNGSVSQKRMGLRPSMLSADQYGKYLLEGITNTSKSSAEGVPDEGWIWTKYARAWIDRPASGYIDKTTPGYVDNIGFTDVKDYTFFDTNPIDMLWNDKVYSTSHDLNFSARTDVMGYRLSLGYLNDGSMLKWGNNSNERYNLRLNFDYKFSKRLTLKTGISLEKNDVIFPTRQGEINFGSQPGFPESTINGKPYAWGTQPGRNWLLELGGDNKTKNNRINVNTKLEYNLLDNLKLVGVAAYSWWDQNTDRQYKFIPEIYNYAETYQYQGNPRQDQSWYEKEILKNVYYNTNAYLEYKKNFADAHDVEVMAGGSYEGERFDGFVTRTTFLASNDVPALNLGLGDNTTKTNDQIAGQWAIASAFGRLKYAYKNKYFVEATGRSDGSSRFEPGNKWTTYFGYSGAWRISQESFLKEVKFLNELKISASYGTVGNSIISGQKLWNHKEWTNLYDYLQQVQVSNAGPVLGGYTSRSVIAGPSPTLRSVDTNWERINTTNLGIDIAVLNNRLSGRFDYFWRKNENMFYFQEYPATLGATAPFQNVGALKGKGWEMSLGWRDKIGDVSYFINGSLTDNTNKVTKLTGNNPITAGQLNRVGYPINSYFGLEYAGRIQNQETAAQYALLVPGSNINNMPAANQMMPGINMYRDLNGDGMLTNASANEYTLGKTDANGNPIANGDIKYLGSSDPRYVFAVNLGADYKGFDFSFVVQGVGQRKIYRRSDWSVPFGTIWQGHADWWVGKTWTPENPDAELPILTTASNRGFGGFNAYNYQLSDWSIQNGAYVRLKNIVLGYTVPQSISRRAKIERLRIYVSGNDVWEFTKVDDNWDPEQSLSVSGGAQRYPFYRLYTVGVNVTF